MSDPVPLASLLRRTLSALGAPEYVEPQAPPPDDVTGIRERAWPNVCPTKFHGATFDALRHPPATLDTLARWAEPGTRGNLFLLGPVGRGKSFAASACARERFLDGQSVAWAPVVELLDRLRVGGDRDVSDYTWQDVLVLDDLGGERPSDWTMERLYAIVNRRWLDGRPIVATSNLEPDVLREVVGERTTDRLRDGAVVLRLGGGESRRRPA